MLASKARLLIGASALALAACGVFGLSGCESTYPEGVETDAVEVRSVTMSGGNYEIVTYDDDMFELPRDNVEVYELADSGCEFMSRDEDTLWIKGQTAERLGLEGLEVLGGEGTAASE